MENFRNKITDALGWFFCEMAFKTGCHGTSWAYRLGCWFYALNSELLTPEQQIIQGLKEAVEHAKHHKGAP